MTDDILEKWKQSLTTDPTAAKRTLERLALHEENNTISPDMDIISRLCDLSQTQIIEQSEGVDALVFWKDVIS